MKLVQNSIGTGSSVIAAGVEFRVRKDILRCNQDSIGKWLTPKLCDLGPTYTKLGQFMASRPDIFGQDLCKHLERLQDKVNPMHFSSIGQYLKGAPVYEHIHSIEPTPLASASIAQVHRACLKNGTEVVVKVRRPNVMKQMKKDVELLNTILEVMRQFDIEGVDDSLKVVQQFSEQMLNETDFVRERKSISTFRSMNDHNPCVRVPRVYDELCSESVLVMEYVPSQKLADIQDVDKRRSVASLLMATFVSQILHGGMAHADPHPGNVGIHPHTQQIVLYDFGNVIELDQSMCTTLKRFILLLMDKDVEGIVAVLPDMGIVVHDRDAVKLYVSSYIDYISTLDVNQLMSGSNGIGNGGGAPGTPPQKVPMTCPGKLLSLGRVFGMLEGTCKTLDPDFQYHKVWPYLMLQVMADPDFIHFKMERDINQFFSSSFPLRAMM